MKPAEPEYGRRHPDLFDEIMSVLLAEGTVSRWPEDLPPPDPALGPAWTPNRPVHVGLTMVVCLTLLGSGVALLLVPGILSQPPALAPSAGLMLIALGLGWIVLRSWPTDPDDRFTAHGR